MMKIGMIALTGLLVSLVVHAEMTLTFSAKSELDNFKTSDGAVIRHDAFGGSSKDGSISLLGGDAKSAYLTAQKIELSEIGQSVSISLKMGPLSLDSVDQAFLPIAGLGLIAAGNERKPLIDKEQDPRVSVLLQTFTDSSIYDARLVLESFDSNRKAFAGPVAELVNGNYYCWIFAVTRQTEDKYFVESQLIDMGRDGCASVEVLSVFSTFRNNQLGGMSLYSGFSRGSGAAHMNQVDEYDVDEYEVIVQ